MKYLTRMRNKYGKIFTFWPGNDAFIVVADTKVVRTILTDTKTFPQIFVNGEFIGGAADACIKWKKGELQPLLEAALLKARTWRTDFSATAGCAASVAAVAARPAGRK